MLLGGACLLVVWQVPAIGGSWESFLTSHTWLSGLLGSLWGALVGAFLIWLFRILGSIIAGREAMGLGDVDLMFGVGAVLGAAGAVYVFFVAPFFGLLFGVYKLIFKRGREVPYVPFLSMATLVVMLFYCEIHKYFGERLGNAFEILRDWLMSGH
jgi:leader peptidase (prepilin peptidase)/N-methyltransferase